MGPSRSEDAEPPEPLLERAKDGDPEALELLLARNEERLRRAADHRLGPALRGRLRCSDILQSTYLQVLGSISRFPGATEHDFANWIVRVLENTIRQRARHWATDKRSERREVRASVDQLDPPAHAGTPSTTVAVTEELHRIARAMTRLRRDYVRILTLHLDPDRTHQETARLMGRSEGASRVLLARARAALLVELRKDAPKTHDG